MAKSSLSALSPKATACMLFVQVQNFSVSVIRHILKTCSELGSGTLCQFLLTLHLYEMSRVVRKPAFCICENKDADQLRGNCEADQRLCFRYSDSTIPLLP